MVVCCHCSIESSVKSVFKPLYKVFVFFFRLKPGSIVRSWSMMMVRYLDVARLVLKIADKTRCDSG